MPQTTPTRESRVKKSLLNARVNLIFYFLTLLLSFFSRKIFLDCLGAEFLGLTGALQNLLGFLNLAELGIASSIGYLLYKPLFDSDHEKINEIISVMGYMYRWIGIAIFVAGCIMACFLPLIFPSTGFDLLLIYFVYSSFLASTLIGYFINYRQNLLGADQRNYVVTGYYHTANIIKTILQLALAWYTKSYYLWAAIEFTFGIVYSFILNWKINQTYPWLQADIRLGRKLFKKYPEVMTKTKQLFIQKISYFVQYQTTPFLIYSFVSLQIVAFYGNYTIITDKIGQLVNAFLESSGASVGNLIAEGNQSKIKRLFWEMLSFRYFIGGVMAYIVYVSISPFVSLWLGSQYILPNVVVLLVCTNVFISFTRGGVMQFLFGYGLFSDIWAPISEVVINLSVACVCGYMWGLPGVLLGGITSQLLIVGIWKPYFLYSRGFRESVWHYWTTLLLYVAPVALSVVPAVLVMRLAAIDPTQSFFYWILFCSIQIITYSVSCYALLFIFTQGMRDLTHRFIHKNR